MPATTRAGILGGLVVALTLAVVAPAEAALAFRFDTANARPGSTVVAFEPGWNTVPAGVVVYLVPTRLPGVMPDPSGSYILSEPPAHHVVKLGRPHLSRSHRIFVRFRVPSLAPGDYTTAFWCRSCAAHGDFFASATWGATPTRAPSAVLRIGR